MSVYECEECSESRCSDCDPEITCDFCSKAICPDCENNSTKSDNRHRIICLTCFGRLSNVEKSNFEKKKDTFNPMTKVIDGKATAVNISKAIEAIKGEEYV